MFASCNFLLSALLCYKSWRGWHGSHPNYQPESLWKKNQQFELDTHQTQSIWYEVPLNHLMQSGFMQAPRRGRILQLIPQTSGIVHLQALCPFMNSTCFLTFNTCFVVGTGSLEVFTIFGFFFFSKLPLWKNHNSTSTIHHILNVVDGIIQVAQGSLRISIWINIFK